MQLVKLSIAASTLLVSLNASDFVSFQYLHYQESDNRVTVSAPSLEINKDFGVDYSLNVNGTYDAVSGASPNYYDASSGASAQRRVPNRADLGRGPTAQEDVAYGNIDFYERRNALGAQLIQRLDSRDEIRYGLNWSLEFDVYAYEGSLEYMHFLDSSKNSSLTLGLSYQRHANLVQCTEYSGGDISNGCDTSSGSSKQIDSNHFNLQGTYSQVLDETSVLDVSLFYLEEDGYLTNTYKNVVRNYDSLDGPIIVNENRPDTRNAGGAVINYAKSIGPNSALQMNYRYYLDDWKINSHTPEIKLLYQATNAIRIDVGYRYYYQSAAEFYSAQKDYFTDEEFASSDDRLSEFNGFQPTLGGIYQINRDWSYNLSYSYYDQSTGLTSQYIITGLKYIF